MLNNVLCVENEEGCSTVGLFTTLGRSVLVYGVLFSCTEGCVRGGESTVHTVLYREIKYYFFLLTAAVGLPAKPSV